MVALLQANIRGLKFVGNFINQFRLLPASTMACLLFLPSAWGQQWVSNKFAAVNWYSVASSADGSILNAAANGGHIYTSTNSGGSWTTNGAPVRNWQFIASSGDGQKLAAIETDSSIGRIFSSTNGGATWFTNGAPLKDWIGVVSSFDGSKLAAAAIGDGIYTSTDGGFTWNPTTAPHTNWYAITGSADGSKLAATSPAQVYTSSDSGSNWTPRNPQSPFAFYQSIASSADGNFLITGQSGNGGAIYTSTNAGVTWHSNNVPRLVWTAFAASADGRVLLAASLNWESIYTSTNSGGTWVSNNVPLFSWKAVACSADGGKMVATTFNNGVWTLQSVTPPQLNVLPSAVGLKLSWVLPSVTNFLLQESPDLLSPSWTASSNQPAFNPASLQLETQLPLPVTNRFYRLTTQ